MFMGFGTGIELRNKETCPSPAQDLPVDEGLHLFVMNVVELLKIPKTGGILSFLKVTSKHI